MTSTTSATTRITVRSVFRQPVVRLSCSIFRALIRWLPRMNAWHCASSAAAIGFYYQVKADRPDGIPLNPRPLDALDPPPPPSTPTDLGSWRTLTVLDRPDAPQAMGMLLKTWSDLTSACEASFLNLEVAAGGVEFALNPVSHRLRGRAGPMATRACRATI